MNIYSKNCYRQILKSDVLSRKKIDSGVTFQSLASAIKVPKSYLSKVIRGDADLNFDQLYGAARYLDYNESERKYLDLLLQHSRSGVEDRKRNLEKEIKSYQQRFLEAKEHIEAKPLVLSNEGISQYYYEPINQIIHVSLSIDKFRNNPLSLAKMLNISSHRLLDALKDLERMGFIESIENEIVVKHPKIHLPRESPVYRAWRQQLKIMGLNQLDRVPNALSHSFSVIFSGDDELRQNVIQLFLEFLKQVEKLAAQSTDEDTYQMSFDLFPWTTKN